MRNYIYNNLSCLIFLLPIFFLICSSNSTSGPDMDSNSDKLYFTHEGLCIYATKVNITSDLDYQDFNLENAELIGRPLISYQEIISYDTNSHVITLSYSSDSLKKRIAQSIYYDSAIGVYGLPFIVTLDSEKKYGGWFWTPVSSIPCSSVVIELDDITELPASNEIKIKPGYPDASYFKGEDPRNDKEIVERLIKDNKIK